MVSPCLGTDRRKSHNKKSTKVKSELYITQSENRNKTKVKIKKKNIDEAGKVLGIHVSVHGSWKNYCEEWVGKSRTFAGLVRRAKFNRVCGVRLFPFLWVPKFRYSAGIIGYTKKQCKNIESPVASACLSASGVNQKFSRAVVFGHIKFGGLGWESMRQVQVYEVIKLFLVHMKLNKELRSLIMVSLETEQLRQGVETPILEQSTKVKEYVEQSWIVNLQKILVDHGMKIRLTTQWTPTKKRKMI